MIFDFSQNNMYVIFETTADNKLILKHFSVNNQHIVERSSNYGRTIVDVHVCGENPNDHHAAKHTGSSGAYSLKYDTHRYYENTLGNKLEFDLSDSRMKVTVHYQFFSGLSAIKCWTVVTNVAEQPLGLEYVSSFAYSGLDAGNIHPNDKISVYVPHNSWCREFDWKKKTLSDCGIERNSPFSLNRVNIYNTGSWSTKEYLPMGAVENTETETTWLWQIENNGSWQWEVGDISNMLYLKLSGPCEQENHWYKELKQGESFESVKVCVAVGKTFNDALADMTAYRRIIFKNNEPNKKMPVIFNDYMNCLNADPTEEKLLPVIDRAAEVGADYFCMDAGWYASGAWWGTIGEWLPDESRFPHGIKYIFDYIKSKGMVPGIWLELENMGINCPLAKEFEDECFIMRHGKRVIDHGRYMLDFRNKRVRDYASAVMDRVVLEYGVGYIKNDYNVDMGIGTEVDSDSFGDGLLKANQALLSWTAEIREKYPHVIFENCASGGMRMDYAMLSGQHIQSTSDATSCWNNAYIAAGAATGVLPEQAAVWSYPITSNDRNTVVANMVNSMLLRIHLSGQIFAWSEEQMLLVKEGISCYKSIRKDIDRSVPFYPLGIPTYTDKWLCAAYHCPTSVRLALWRTDKAEEEVIFIPLEEDYQNANILYPSVCDAKIKRAANGIEVSMPSRPSAVIIELN